MPRRLNISINPDGTIVAESSGTPGPGCVDSINPLEAMLQAEVIDSRPTPEFSGTKLSSLKLTEQTQNLEDFA